jgi:hypothetical protein
MCIADHDLLRSSRLLFALLTAPVGLMVTPADEYGPREVLALGNCTCNSTIAIDVTDEHQEST